ncbi:UNVERIFIED_CONTAM: hypothetical protein HDU68_008132 [Siphonaria sp. JEL0065]|nr:hypothetical protein HDU68_008132 [Siphonaria sp. JEL0065]
MSNHIAILEDGMPAEPTTARNSIKIHLIAFPVVYLIWTIVAALSYNSKFLLAYYGGNTVVIALFNATMYYAMQPAHLSTGLTTAFIAFTILRCLVNIGWTAYAVVIAIALGTFGGEGDIVFSWGYVFLALVFLTEVVFTYLLVKNAGMVKKYALEVRRVLSDGSVVK